MPFSDPSTTTGLPYDELLGALLVVDVHEQLDEIQTNYGPSTPIRADVYVLDGAHKGDEYLDTLIFKKVMIGQLRKSIGSKVIGRLGLGTAKPGQSAPWKLDAATEADRAVGARFEQYHAQQTAATTLPDEEPF